MYVKLQMAFIAILIEWDVLVDKNLKFAQNEGLSSQKQNLKTSEWVLKRIYQIQQNSKFRNSLKINTYE